MNVTVWKRPLKNPQEMSLYLTYSINGKSKFVNLKGLYTGKAKFRNKEHERLAEKERMKLNEQLLNGNYDIKKYTMEPPFFEYFDDYIEEFDKKNTKKNYRLARNKFFVYMGKNKNLTFKEINKQDAHSFYKAMCQSELSKNYCNLFIRRISSI
jgi:hypothetical protein